VSQNIGYQYNYFLSISCLNFWCYIMYWY